MAARLVHAGHEVRFYDADFERARSFADEVGGRQVRQVSETAADVIITMLPSSAVVAAVLEGDDGLLANLSGGALLLEMSSGDPIESRRLAAAVKAAGGRFLDAPVSGGVLRAKTGELAIMAGGAADDVERARPVLELIGNSVTHTGDVGSAHAMKALNNLVSAGGLLGPVSL